MLLVISSGASLDTFEIAIWYEKQAPFLGNRFLDDLQQIYDKILSFPEAFGLFNKYSGIRKSRLKDFPYNIYYIIEKTEIRVIAVIHASRSSRFVKRRLR